MATVYRSVKLVLQNSTDEKLTVQGVATLKGQWNDKMTPKQGDEVPEQSSISWVAESSVLGTGASGFVRVGSVRGYTKLWFSLPWVGEFRFEPEVPEGLHLDHKVDMREPDAVVVEATLWHHHRHETDAKR